MYILHIYIDDGLVNFTSTSFSAREDGGTVNLTLIIKYSPDEVMLRFSTYDSTAHEGKRTKMSSCTLLSQLTQRHVGLDFVGINHQVVKFSPNQELITIVIQLIDDELVEGTENFMGILEVINAQGHMDLTIPVLISDNERRIYQLHIYSLHCSLFVFLVYT